MNRTNWIALALTSAGLTVNLVLLILDVWPSWMYDGWLWEIDKEISRALGMIISIVLLAIMLVMAIWIWWVEDHHEHSRCDVVSMRRR